MTVTLRSPRPDEADELTELILRSKAHWGYDQDFIDLIRADMAVDLDSPRLRLATVAEVDGRPAAMMLLLDGPPSLLLDSLFVEPWAIGTGLGTMLFRLAVDHARMIGCTEIRLASDPHAEGFYLRLGAVRVGENISPTTGVAHPRLILAL
ncbi:putative N-acetyltransferase YhbS [Allocatelliglobosispora scoriae]|uniref:Putative N-acetyltransferase YhbS n=1 Tax=Allocatelliglobosispora scoriae TaxID=643052 RepID=A0A841BJI6_9ACTN|nr:GNAT family N-acetyltransferase [Allocatelliglobosispora scoriae]MBB5866980.1 putative N-acetyltransferase YhbS [Allocatelliglobosispora scoriae]